MCQEVFDIPTDFVNIQLWCSMELDENNGGWGGGPWLVSIINTGSVSDFYSIEEHRPMETPLHFVIYLI